VQCSASTQGRDPVPTQPASAWALSTSAWQVAPTRTRLAGHHTRVGAFKEAAAADRADHALTLTGPIPSGSTGSPSWLRACWLELRQTAAAQKRVALVLANYPTATVGWPNGVGLDTTARHGPELSWLKEAGPQPRSSPLPRERRCLIQLCWAGRSN